MASIPNPEPSKPADKKPAPPKPSHRMGLSKVLIFIFFLILCGFVAFPGRFTYSDPNQTISLLLQQNKQTQAYLASLSLEIEILKNEAGESRRRVPHVDSQGLSDEYREAFNSELDLLRLSYKKLLKERDVLEQEIEKLRKQLNFVQTTELMELKNRHQKEVEMLRGEILYVKKEVLLIIQDLAGNLFDENMKSKFNEDIFSDKNKKDVKSKPAEWIENAYQSFTSFVTESVPKAASNLGDTAKNGFEKVKNYVDETAPKVVQTITASAQETAEKVKDLGQQVGESAKEGMNKAKTFVNEKVPEVERLGKAAKEKLENVKEFVEENVPKMAIKIGETAKEGMEKVKDFVGEKAPEVIHKIEETAKESFETVKDYVEKTAPKVADTVEAAAKEAFEGLKTVGGKAKETGEKIADQAKKLSESLLNFWKK